ncbi:MAG: hypothetical protein NVSMB1_08510 [Polyangiales bacterium]
MSADSARNDASKANRASSAAAASPVEKPVERPVESRSSHPETQEPSRDAPLLDAPLLDAPLLDAMADAEGSRNAPWWDAGGNLQTLAFWFAVAVFLAALFRTTILPFVDYPQHLALAAILRRMLVPGAPERALFESNLLSYNSLFHVAVAGLNVLVPIDVAGKLVIGIYVILASVATLALLRATGRPRARAFLILPVMMGYAIVWGFVNFGLGLAIQLMVLARLLDRSRQIKRRTRSAIPYDLITCTLALAGAYAHLLATALAYMLMLTVIVVRVQTARSSLATRLGRAVRNGLPLLPAIAYCLLVYRAQERSSHRNYEYAIAEGNDGPALVKVKEFLGYATGFRTDLLDAKILSLGLGLLLLGALLRDPDDESEPTLRWLFVVSLFAYLVIPHVFWATNFVFERISFLVVLSAILWAPRARPQFESSLRLLYVSVGLAAAWCFFGAMNAARAEVADLDAVLNEAPKGRRVTGLVFNPRLPSTLQWSMLHSPAYYVARNGGEVAFSFTRTMSLPVHYREGLVPPDPPANFEWNPGDYRENAAYARYFDVVLMKTTYDDQIDPRPSVWKNHFREVDTLAHHGRWWVFDTKRVTPDPPSSLSAPFAPRDETEPADPEVFDSTKAP